MAQGMLPDTGARTRSPGNTAGCVLAVILLAFLGVGCLVLASTIATFALAERLPAPQPAALLEWKESLRVTEESIRVIDRQLGPLTIECTARIKNVSNRRQDPVLIFQFLGEHGQEIHRRQFVPLSLNPGRDELIIRHTTMNPEEFEQVKTFRVAE